MSLVIHRRPHSAAVALIAVARVAGFMVVALMLTCCDQEVSLPKTSPEAEKLRWVERVDVLADFRDHVERNRDTRFLSAFGLSFATEFPGLQETPELQQLVKINGSRRLEGTTDVITSWEHQRLLHELTFYATRYNSMLLGYLECKAESKPTMQHNIPPRP